MQLRRRLGISLEFVGNYAPRGLSPRVGLHCRLTACTSYKQNSVASLATPLVNKVFQIACGGIHNRLRDRSVAALIHAVFEILCGGVHGELRGLLNGTL